MMNYLSNEGCNIIEQLIDRFFKVMQYKLLPTQLLSLIRLSIIVLHFQVPRGDSVSFDGKQGYFAITDHLHQLRTSPKFSHDFYKFGNTTSNY